MAKLPKRVLRHPGTVALVSALGYLLLWAADRTGFVGDLDRTVFFWMREVRGPWLDVLGRVDDVAFRVTPTFALAIAIAAALAWLGPRWAWTAPLSIAVTALVEFLTKHSWRTALHPRELIAAAQELLGGRFLEGASFPSGHVARAAFLAIIAVRFLPRPLAVPAVLAALATGFARVYTEAHRLSDVVGGAALGVSVGCLALWWVDSRNQAAGEPVVPSPAARG